MEREQRHSDAALQYEQAWKHSRRAHPAVGATLSSKPSTHCKYSVLYIRNTCIWISLQDFVWPLTTWSARTTPWLLMCVIRLVRSQGGVIFSVLKCEWVISDRSHWSVFGCRCCSSVQITHRSKMSFWPELSSLSVCDHVCVWFTATGIKISF